MRGVRLQLGLVFVVVVVALTAASPAVADEIDGPPVVSAHVERLASRLATATTASARRRAARALRTETREPFAVTALTVALAEDPDTGVRLAAVRALDGVDAGCPALRWASTVDESRRVRLAARHALDHCPAAPYRLGSLVTLVDH